MKYKLYDIVKPVSEKNKDGLYTSVLGVAIEKEFMPSVANLNGTDLKKYSIVRKGRFAFNPMHIGRDERIPVALYIDTTPALVSPAYSMFENKNNCLAIDEYLMLIFKSPSFDHLCWFYTDGSVRGGLSWDDFANIEISLPSIDEQKKIVKQYKTIDDRIRTLSSINYALENTIDIYFAKLFPNLYKGNNKLGEYVECSLGGTPSRDIPSYWNGDINWINSGEVNNFRIIKPSEFITKEGMNNSSTNLLPKHTVVLAITGATLGQESILLIDSCANQSVVGIKENSTLPYQFIHPLVKGAMTELLKNQTGGAQPHINNDDVKNIAFQMPDESLILSFSKKTTNIYNTIENNCYQIHLLEKMKECINGRL